MNANGSSDDESEAEFERLLALSAAKTKSLHRRPLSQVKTTPRMQKHLSHSPVKPPVWRLTPIVISSSDSSPELPQARIRIRRTTPRKLKDVSPVKPPVRRLAPIVISSPDSSPELRRAKICKPYGTTPECPIIILSTPSSECNNEQQDGLATPKQAAKQMHPFEVDATASSNDESYIEFERLLTASIAKMKLCHNVLPSSTSSTTTPDTRPRWRYPHSDDDDDFGNDVDDETGSSSSWTRRKQLPRTEPPPVRRIVPRISNSGGRISPAFETWARISPEGGPIINLSTSARDDDGTQPVDPVSAPLIDVAERRKCKTDVFKQKPADLDDVPVPTTPVDHKLGALKIRLQDLFDDSSLLEDDGTEKDDARKDADRFLRSLDLLSRVDNRHPAALPYLSDLNRNRFLLADHLYRLFNTHVFNDRLPRDMTITWNSRMTHTAGFCKCRYTDRVTLTRTCFVVLSSTLLNTADRVRDTLIHELCHAATWLISEYWDIHGPFWRCYARRANVVFPSLPLITRCHNYIKR